MKQNFPHGIMWYLLFFAMVLISVDNFGQITLQRYSIRSFSQIQPPTANVRILQNNGSHGESIFALKVNFRQYSNPYFGSNYLNVANRVTLSDHLEAAVMAPVLVGPSPMRLGAQALVSYHLNKHTSVEIHIYNQFGRRLFKQVLLEGSSGAQLGENLVQIDSRTFNYFELSAGVYFLFLYDLNQRLIGKTKFSIVP